MLFQSAAIAVERRKNGSQKTKLSLVADQDKDAREVIKGARKYGEETKADVVMLKIRGISLGFAPSEAVDDLHVKYLKAIEERALAFRCYRPEKDLSAASTAPVHSL